MIRMTKQADYGIVLLTRMATEPDRLFNATELAEETHLPQPTVSKILKTLAREGLLLSQRGVKGGYTLDHDPATMSVADVIAALEGPIAITECIDESPGLCRQEAFCPVRGNWHRINDAIRRALSAISLAEMTQPLPRNLVTLGEGEVRRTAELG
jgi:FeS assembly SUF system regulator